MDELNWTSDVLSDTYIFQKSQSCGERNQERDSSFSLFFGMAEESAPPHQQAERESMRWSGLHLEAAIDMK